jgi:hypothetical protein
MPGISKVRGERVSICRARAEHEKKLARVLDLFELKNLPD